MRWSEATIPSKPASSSIGATVTASAACMNAVPDQNCIRPPVPVRGDADHQGDHGAMTDDELDELYWVKPEDFTAVRSRLVAAAKGRGDAAAAKQIAAARKPTAPALATH